MNIENIKFKAKSLNSGKWIEGDLIRQSNGIYIRRHKNLSVIVDASTVCQFTGLKDCKGNEIWEGDILQDVDDDYIKYVVIFGEGAFLAQKEGHYTGIPLHECVGSLGNDVITYAKVVGNKFDKDK
jgi:hypothetical protein